MNHTNSFDVYYDNTANRSPPSRNQTSRQQSVPTLDTVYADFEPLRHNGYATIRGPMNGYHSPAADINNPWNTSTFGHGGLAGLGMSGPPMRKVTAPARPSLPQAWMEMNAGHGNAFMTAMGNTSMSNPNIRSDVGPPSDMEDELILTAIVIKNIPFAVKKEQLVAIMTDLGLPLPYAFNYHFDHGVFRGLAFANFTNPDETSAVIDALNHFELNGRKLRVEYKKMLPAAERERIEREKRERRGQLEEQHRPIMATTIHQQPSLSTMNSRLSGPSPSPVSARNLHTRAGWSSAMGGDQNHDVDLNDPTCLAFYSKLLLFKEDPAREFLTFPCTLQPPERRIVHVLAHHMGLGHTSKGDADRRSVHVFKETTRSRISPPLQHLANMQHEQKRTINRAATTDFSDMRGGADQGYASGARQLSTSYLGGHGTPDMLNASASGLRTAKSYADLRSFTPSPAQSSASFPAAFSNPMGRLPEGSETGLISGLGNLALGGTSPGGLRGLGSLERENPGPIGSNRSLSNNHDDRNHTRSGASIPPSSNLERLARGPLPERSAGYSRPRVNGHVPRSSDELSQQSSNAPEITIGQ